MLSQGGGDGQAPRCLSGGSTGLDGYSGGSVSRARFSWPRESATPTGPTAAAVRQHRSKRHPQGSWRRRPLPPSGRPPPVTTGHGIARPHSRRTRPLPESSCSYLTAQASRGRPRPPPLITFRGLPHFHLIKASTHCAGHGSPGGLRSWVGHQFPLGSHPRPGGGRKAPRPTRATLMSVLYT